MATDDQRPYRLYAHIGSPYFGSWEGPRRQRRLWTFLACPVPQWEGGSLERRSASLAYASRGTAGRRSPRGGTRSSGAAPRPDSG